MKTENFTSILTFPHIFFFLKKGLRVDVKTTVCEIEKEI